MQGTAIGTKLAPLYSILFMAKLEEEILREVEWKPYLWWWYIDDIFFILEHGEEILKEFIDVLNKKHPTIKFTAEWSKTQINCLDVTVYLENGKIKIELYFKPTDTHQYLHSSSCHPNHCKKGIFYSQMLCLNRICSDSRSLYCSIWTSFWNIVMPYINARMQFRQKTWQGESLVFVLLSLEVHPRKI